MVVTNTYASPTPFTMVKTGVQARYTPLQWKIYFLNLQLSYKKDIPLYNLVKENEQVSFEQNQHIPTSLLEPLPLIPPSKIYPLYNLVRENEQVLNKIYPLYTDLYISK